MTSGLHQLARRVVGTALIVAPVVACSGGPLDPRGPVAAPQRLLIFNALAVMLAIVIPTILAAIGFTWWFRASNPHAKRHPHFVYSGRVEIVMWAIPALTGGMLVSTSLAGEL